MMLRTLCVQSLFEVVYHERPLFFNLYYLGKFDGSCIVILSYIHTCTHICSWKCPCTTLPAPETAPQVELGTYGDFNWMNQVVTRKCCNYQPALY